LLKVGHHKCEELEHISLASIILNKHEIPYDTSDSDAHQSTGESFNEAPYEFSKYHFLLRHSKIQVVDMAGSAFPHIRE